MDRHCRAVNNQLKKEKNIMNPQLVLLVPIGESNLPGFGGGFPASPGHPSAGLPIQPGHPDHGLPGGGHVANRPPNVPPNVVWPPQFNPAHPGNELPPELGHPGHPLPVPPGQPLPPNAALILAYTQNHGWNYAIIQTAQPK